MCLKPMRTIPYDDYNRRLGTDYIGAVKSTFGNTPFKNGWKLIEIYED